MKKTEHATTTFRQLIAKGTVMMPGVPSAVMGGQVERAGFDAVYVSGAGMANATAGVPDIGLLTLIEVVHLAGYVAKAVNIPAIVDADTGFGGAENVARTSQELGKAGLAGCHIEDQDFPKRCGHLSGSVAKRGRVSRFRKGDRPAVARKHDRVRQESVAFHRATLRFRLPDGDFPDERLPGCHESERSVLPRVEKDRHPIGLAR